MENKIYSVLEKYGIDEPKASAITEDLLFLCAVSQQREPLLAYHRYLVNALSLDIYEVWVDEHLKANNCG